MSFKFFSTKLFKVLIIFFICLFLIFLNPYNFFNPIRSVFFAIFAPIQKVGYGLGYEFLSLKKFLSSIGELKKENENLIRENRELLAAKARMEETGKENEVLRQQLKLLPRDKFNLEGANVISQDFYGKGDWLEINKGKTSGIEKEMPVIVDSGILIGTIEEVYSTTSKVILLNNSQSTINVIDLKTNSKGVVKGEYGLGIIMDMVLQSDSLNKGDEIVTSGVGKNFPQGLFIGRVEAIGTSPDRLFQKAVIASPVDFSNLKFVFVIKGNN